jgi:ornithine--oxo-acid transaminase
MSTIIKREEQFCAHNYHPLPVVLVKGEGALVWDENGREYIDMMSAYSAVSHGHRHPKIVKALEEQLSRLAIVSRSYYSDTLANFLQYACELFGYDKGLPMNTGAEAVETALKLARKWGYKVKKVPADKAEIIACRNNFHGRTIAIVGMSTEEQYRDGFGPFPAGFNIIPYGDVDALEKAITPNTVAFIVEPIQGEAGIMMPPVGYLKKCAELCKRHNVLLIADEIQTGLGRTGKRLACDHEGVKPDILVLGKALGGGVLPISLVLADDAIMSVLHPGDHGSTFGGYALAAAVGLAALKTLEEEKLAERAEVLGERLMKGLKSISHPVIRDIRGKGLMIGIEIDPKIIHGHDLAEKFLQHGILTKETHHVVMRLAPPLVISEALIDRAIEAVKQVFAEVK